MSASHPPIRPEYELPLEPFEERRAERRLSRRQRLWQQDGLRKLLILIALALLW